MNWLKRGLSELIPTIYLSALIVLGACQFVAEPHLENLLLGRDDLPGEWVVSVEGPHPPSGSAPLGGGFGAMEALVVFFYHPAGDGNAGAHEQLFLFRTNSEAEEAYEKLHRTAFKERSDWYWSPPDFNVPTLTGASESQLRCTKDRSEEMCRLVARYGKYLLDLKVDLFGLNSQLEPVRVLSNEDFIEIIDKLEIKMTSAIPDEN